MILLPEHIRRFREMSAVSQPENLGFIEEHTFVVNAQNPVVSKLGDTKVLNMRRLV